MARGQVIGIRVAFALACSLAGSCGAVADSGTTILLQGGTLSGLGTVTATSVGITSSGLTATVSGVSLPVLGTSITAASINISGSGATVALPNVNLPGVSLATTPLSVNLALGQPLLELPGVGITVAGQRQLILLDNGLLGDLINQVSPITQLFAGIGSTEALAPMEQLLDGFAFGELGSPDCSFGGSAALAPLPVSNAWTWNAVTMGTADHSGYQVQQGGDAPTCRSTLPLQSLERTQLPGLLWDASSALGLKRGTLHVGFTGGGSEKDVQIKASAMLRDAGVTHAGSARLTSWSMGSFALLTTGTSYAGSAIGAGWGRSESANYVLGSASDYDTSTVFAAGILGKILPLTDALRFDVRGTLAYQRTVGDAHVDTLGIVYGDHSIESVSATLSGRLFGVFRQGDLAIRPYLQAGVSQRLHYDNQLEVGGIAVTFDEADTSLFAATGLDLEISQTLQFSAGVRQDYSRNSESVTGRFGLSLKLN